MGRQISTDEMSLFIMWQEWASPAHLEAHLRSRHAQSFNDAVVSKQVLVREPSVSLFSLPLSASDLATLGAEATAAAAALSTQLRAQEQLDPAGRDQATAAVAPAAASNSGLGGSAAMRSPSVDGRHAVGSPSSSAGSSRRSVLQQSGSMALRRTG